MTATRAAGMNLVMVLRFSLVETRNESRERCPEVDVKEDWVRHLGGLETVSRKVAGYEDKASVG